MSSFLHAVGVGYWYLIGLVLGLTICFRVHYARQIKPVASSRQPPTFLATCYSCGSVFDARKARFSPSCEYLCVSCGKPTVGPYYEG